MRYLSEIFWRHSWDVCTQLPNNYKFLVCLLVLLLAYFLTEIRQIWIYLLIWKSYLFEFFRNIPGIFLALPLPFGQIWHGASLDTIIPKEQMRWTMCCWCLGHKRAKIWLFLPYLNVWRGWFLALPLPFGQIQSSTSWYLHLLTPFLSFSLSFFLTPEESWKNLSILLLVPWSLAWSIPRHIYYDSGRTN